jgi:GAF domain-containing protein
LVSNPAVIQTLQQVVATKQGETLRALPEQRVSESPSSDRYLNLAFRPLFSSSGRVTSVLVVVDDATADVSWRMQLEKAQELAQLGLEYLTTIAPLVDFGVAVTAPAAARGSPYAIAFTPGWEELATNLDTSRVGAVLRQCASSGKRIEVGATEGSPSLHVTAAPLLIHGANKSMRTLGAVAWGRPSHQAIPPEQDSAVDAFVALLAVAAELLHVRMEALHKASQLEAIIGTASVVPLSGGPTGLGTRFLERLASVLRADRAAIGRVDGSRFVVEAAYEANGDGPNPGDRLPASRHVLESARSREPVARSRPALEQSAFAQMRHELSVPLVLAAEVIAVITVERNGDLPYDSEEVKLVQTLSSVGLLSVSLSRRDSTPT